MRKKLAFVFTPLLLSVNTLFILLNSCNNKCGPAMCGYYNSATLTPIDNADSTTKAPASTGVLAKAFLLMLTVNDTAYQCVRIAPGLPVNSAYAECIKSVKMSVIEHVSLVSDHDFDSAHPAGSDLKSLFGIRDTGYVNFIHVGSNNLYLLHAPADTGTHIFTIKLFMRDSVNNKNLTAISQPVKLLL